MNIGAANLLNMLIMSEKSKEMFEKQKNIWPCTFHSKLIPSKLTDANVRTMRDYMHIAMKEGNKFTAKDHRGINALEIVSCVVLFLRYQLFDALLYEHP